MPRFLDLRSDTVTQPTPEMRRAMAEAVVGDDVMGEDPTVQELEARAAEAMGTEGALFVPTGTMANQIAVWVHTARQGQVVCERNSHIALYEGGAAALLCGAHVRTVAGPGGVFGRRDLASNVMPDDPHFARTRLVAMENSHNWSGGQVWDPQQAADLVEAAHAVGAACHVDGARIFNAAVAQGVRAQELMGEADTVMFSLSKGLSAPVGSLLCGDAVFLHEARRVRKALGGGMRQAGVLAAAGLVALGMVDRLAEDHVHARRLAGALDGVPGLIVDPAQVRTNMVLADITGTGMTVGQFCDVAREVGVGCLPRDNGPTARFVTHRHIDAADVDEATARLRALLET